MLLATDLDGTFLAGSLPERQGLRAWMDGRGDVTLAYVTGRGWPLVRPLRQDPDVADPDVVICDVGATVLDADGRDIEPLASEIAARWPGEAAVLQALAGVPGLVRQTQPQARRCSYHCAPEAVTPALRDRAGALGCDVLYSAGSYLDILPGGVNKGSTLVRLVAHLGVDPGEVLVAGDTLNDLSLYGQGFKGVCVGGSEPGLLEATRGRADVLHASRPGCGGILEALAHFGWRDGPAAPGRA